MRRTVLEARNHPSVITHSVANELSPRPGRHADDRHLPRTRRASWPRTSTTRCRPRSTSWPGPGFPKQEVYDRFDLLGLNSYFGWYNGDSGHETGDLADLEPFLRTARGYYRRQALVMTEFGAEATMDGPADRQGDLRLPGAVHRREPVAHQAPRVHVRRDLLDAARVRRQAGLGRRRRAHGRRRATASTTRACSTYADGDAQAGVRRRRRATSPRRRSTAPRPRARSPR